MFPTSGPESLDTDARGSETPGEQWLVVAVYTGEARVRAEPFDASELDLGGLWNDSPQ